MAFIKANKFWIIFGLIGAVAIGLGVWGFLNGSEVEAKMTNISQLTNTVRGLQNGAQNSASVAAKAQEVERRKKEAERAKDVALSVQKNNAFYAVEESGELKAAPRKPLVDNVLPAPAGNSDALRFREVYSKEFETLTTRLRPGQKPALDAIQAEQVQIDMGKRSGVVPNALATPWDIFKIFSTSPTRVDLSNLTPLELLRDWAASRVAYRDAGACRVYVEPNAFGRHALALATTPPSAIEIWQAQMSLWIQQDIVTAIARTNERRAAELVAANRPDDDWVAHMPVKHIEKVAIGNHLGGPGGGSNIEQIKWATSMTGKVANNDFFVVPIQLHLVVEEAALPSIMESFCGVGFYTPVGVQFWSVKPNPLQVNYVYGDAPVVKLVLDMEGYYFHVVFGQWIPKDLQESMKKQYVDSAAPGGAGGGGLRIGGRR